MKNLYELSDEYLFLLDMLSDPETSEEEIDEALTKAEDDIVAHADDYGKIIRELESSIDVLKGEQSRLASRKKKAEDSIKKLKESLQAAMVAVGKKNIKTDLFTFAVQKNGGKLPVVLDVECADLPDELVKISESPDTDAIREYLDTHKECKYAHYGERGESLRIK